MNFSVPSFSVLAFRSVIYIPISYNFKYLVQNQLQWKSLILPFLVEDWLSVISSVSSSYTTNRRYLRNSESTYAMHFTFYVTSVTGFKHFYNTKLFRLLNNSHVSYKIKHFRKCQLSATYLNTQEVSTVNGFDKIDGQEESPWQNRVVFI